MSGAALAPYLCATPGCRHAFYRHRESREWQLLNPRRRRNLHGCTAEGCPCQQATTSAPPTPEKDPS